MAEMLSVLSIAGSDSSGGAGIQADIKTIEANKLFATTVITSITAQNTTGVRAVFDIPPHVVSDQIDAVFEDIPPEAVKIGMVSSPEIISAIADRLEYWDAINVVLDPVMVATSGARLIEDSALDILESRLIPLASIVTPNIPEAEILSGIDISDRKDMEEAAHAIQDKVMAIRGKGMATKEVAQGSATIEGAVVEHEKSDLVSRVFPTIMLKGGHSVCDASDLVLTSDGKAHWLEGVKIDNPNTHGTGCSLSSAIACGLALGLDDVNACAFAKEYVAGAIGYGLDLGQGSGPLNHMWEYMD